MGFWDNVNDELKKAVEESWSVVKENARIGKLRYRLHTLHKKADRHFAEIGGIVYEMGKYSSPENPLTKPDITRLIEAIKRIEAETRSVEEEIDRLKGKEAPRAPREQR